MTDYYPRSIIVSPYGVPSHPLKGFTHLFIGHTGYTLTRLSLVDFSTEDFLTIPSCYGFYGADIDLVRRRALFVSIQYSTIVFIDIDSFTEVGTLTIPGGAGLLVGGSIIIDSINGFAYIVKYTGAPGYTYDIAKINIDTMLVEDILTYTNAGDGYIPENHTTGTFWLDGTYLYFSAIYISGSFKMGIGRVDLSTFTKAGYATGANIYSFESCGRNLWDSSGNLYQGFYEGATANQYINKYASGPTFVNSLLLGTNEYFEGGNLAITSDGKFIIYPTVRTGILPTMLGRINTDSFTEDAVITLPAGNIGLYNYAAYDEIRDVFYVSVVSASGIWKVTPDPFATVTKKLLTNVGAVSFVMD